jgi:hypothetical protein
VTRYHLSTAEESAMKRLATSLVFAAAVLMPAMCFAQSQPRPTTRIVPCDAACKQELCTDKGAEHAKAVCGGASAENMNQCIVRNERKYIDQCMRAPLGED